MSLSDAATEALAISIASKTTYTAGTVSFMGWLASLDLLSLVGVSVAIAGFVVNLYFLKRREWREKERFKQETKEHKERLRQLEIERQIRQEFNGEAK